MKKSLSTIYLDHASTTPLDPRVKKIMNKYLSKSFANPSALYSLGRQAKKDLEYARRRVAKILNCNSNEIFFTGSGTESDNLAILGVARAAKRLARGNHIITSRIEHPAVLNACKALEKDGFKVTYLAVDKYGLIDPKDLEKALTPKTILVSIMHANNEIGTIEPITKLARIARAQGTYFHTDACQSQGTTSIDVKKLGIDLMTLNGSKIYGPKGVGVLFIKDKTLIDPITYGGSQEHKMRSGTENLCNIMGFTLALKIAENKRTQETKRQTKLRDYMIAKLLKNIPEIKLNGHPTKRLPNNVHISIAGVEGEAVLLHLDQMGICAATGSACSSESLEPSHVVMALGVPYELAHGSLRFTLGRSTTKRQIDYLINQLTKIVKGLRSFSPVKISLKKNV